MKDEGDGEGTAKAAALAEEGESSTVGESESELKEQPRAAKKTRKSARTVNGTPARKAEAKSDVVGVNTDETGAGGGGAQVDDGGRKSRLRLRLRT